ncbi:MAG: hypothetical protein QHC78_09360 [Pigmentiphaga sp.]|uniref:DUF4286 family protein n=1 Tax=Pigmentiphaga sp. TaxID=1977564 RepID=UPI0029AE92A2|nr:DUF4286 family protein [Pigmentiphaga sp.]MDX3905882.1 hypothetical protein [Pigmentiphaga sp.]
MQAVVTDWWRLPTDKLADFIAWQDGEYLPALGVAGHGCRYGVIAGEHVQVSWYGVDAALLRHGVAAADNDLPPLPIWLKLLNGHARERFALELKADVGDTAGPPAPFRYIVQADIPAELVDEYNHWYDQEHLPRLVKVPGVRRARRYTAIDASPYYLTAYDIDAPETWESPAALAARKTPWTERMRGVFQNSRRSMLKREYPA